MVVELISVGTELLLGNIVNTNTQFLAEKCALLGLTMYHQVTVGDNHDRLAEVIRTALKRSDVIILTGGLGPTEDDLTKEVCAEVIRTPESGSRNISRIIFIKSFQRITGNRRSSRRDALSWTMTMELLRV